MTKLRVPILPIKSQELVVQLGGQSCRIRIHWQTYALYVDLYVNDALIIGGVIAQNLNRIVRSKYLGFTGDLYFFDTMGRSDPTWQGLNDRFVLIYDEAL